MNQIDELPIRAYSLEHHELGIMLRDLGPADCVIIYSGLSEEETQSFVQHIKQPYTLIKTGVAPLELK